MSTNFNELSGLKQWGAVIAGGALVTAALYFAVFKSQSDKNAAAQHAVEIKVRENNELESYRPKLKDMEGQLAKDVYKRQTYRCTRPLAFRRIPENGHKSP